MPFTAFTYGDPAVSPATLNIGGSGGTGGFVFMNWNTGNALPVPIGTVLAGGTVGVAYSGETFVAQGGNSPYTFSLLSGGLPSGLSLNSSTGVVSGTPLSTGTSTFTIQVTDSASHTGSQTFSMTISAASGGGGGGSYTFIN